MIFHFSTLSHKHVFIRNYYKRLHPEATMRPKLTTKHTSFELPHHALELEPVYLFTQAHCLEHTGAL